MDFNVTRALGYRAAFKSTCVYAIVRKGGLQGRPWAVEAPWTLSVGRSRFDAHLQTNQAERQSPRRPKIDRKPDPSQSKSAPGNDFKATARCLQITAPRRNHMIKR